MIVMMMGEEDLEKFDKEVQAGSGSPQSADCISTENAGLAACLTNGSSQERDAAAITVSTTPTYEPPPNGGLTAWLQVVGSFFLFFNTWGIVNSFGVFQTYYETHLDNESPSSISWIGSTQAFLLLVVGVATGVLFDKGYFRPMLWVGSVMVVFGTMMTSIAKEFTHIILAQGLCVGIAQGLLFVSSVAILPQHFTTKKALANGIAASGSSLGGIIYPIVFRQMEQSVGFGWATRTIAFLAFFTLGISISLLKLRAVPRTTRKLLDLGALKELPFALFSLSMFFGFIGLYGPIFYLPSYAISNNIMSENLAFYLLPVLNAASIFGRIIPNYCADRIGPFNVLTVATFTTAALCLAWLGIHNTAGLFAFAAVYGFASGGFVSLPPPALVSLSPSIGVLGTRMGMCFGFSSLGVLIGSPLGGQILSKAHSWSGLQAFSGATIFVTAILILATRITKGGFKIKVKV